jgi:hypothetical protein
MCDIFTGKFQQLAMFALHAEPAPAQPEPEAAEPGDDRRTPSNGDTHGGLPIAARLM